MNKGLKITALLFFMLVSASIMTHSVICHHHLGDIQSINQCDHTSCHGNIEDCTLTKIYIKFENHRQLIQLHSVDFDFLPCILTLFSDYSIPQIADAVGLPFRQNPYVISYQTEYISQSLGLRAPPAC